MPNWCCTNITITHNDEMKIKEFSRLLREWTSFDRRENGFGHKWLGNVVLGSGVGTVDAERGTDLRCRGRIVDYYLSDNELVINTETAWVPMLKMWLKVLEKYLPNAELIYNAEECGCGLSYTNDPTLVGKYILDYYGDGGFESIWEADKDTVIEVLQEMLDTMETSVERLIEMAYDNDLEMSIHEWKYADASEWG